MTKFRPLLAYTIEDTAALTYPVLISEKLDGIRCLVIDGVAVSRSMKPIRNKYVQSVLGKHLYDGLDGELVIGDPRSPTCYRDTNSGVMSAEGEPDFTYYVFDMWDKPMDFEHRYYSLRSEYRIQVVPHIRVADEAGLLKVEAAFLERGAEGIMVRSISGGYKQGRSTVKDGILGKLKRFSDNEYKVVGFQERMKNENVATTNALGYTERSTHKENKSGRGDLGALVLQTEDGLTFNCGSGFDDAQRREIWDNQTAYLGRLAKVKSFLVGVKDLPRFPVFLGWRDEADMS